VLGPEIAPHNPYLIQRIQWIDGELDRAPFDPSETYPLGTDGQGRDILSLLLVGTRTTLVIALLATTVRILLGLVLGALAGWRPGGFVDRFVTLFAGFFAAIPGLVLAIFIVYAVGIRQGQVAFIVALSIVGWGEVAQIFRSHVYDIRKESYIESAQAVGLSQIEILSRHVLPNLFSTMKHPIGAQCSAPIGGHFVHYPGYLVHPLPPSLSRSSVLTCLGSVYSDSASAADSIPADYPFYALLPSRWVFSLVCNTYSRSQVLKLHSKTSLETSILNEPGTTSSSLHVKNLKGDQQVLKIEIWPLHISTINFQNRV
jgi:hypothetical protein